MSRQTLIRFFTFIGGLYFFLEYLLPEEIAGYQFNRYHDQITQGLMAVTAMAFGLGIINIIFIHGSRVLFVRKGWINSLSLLLGLVAMFVVTLREWNGSYQITMRVKPLSVLAQFSQAIAEGLKTEKYDLLKTKERTQILEREITQAIEQAKLPREYQASLSSDEHSRINASTQAYNEGIGRLKELLPRLQGDSEQLLKTLPLVSAELRGAAQIIQEQAQIEYRYSFDALIYKVLYEGLFIALGSAMFALLGFYMAAAAYRAFRVRSFESALMMTAAVIVMLGQIPFGLWIWEGFTDLRLWLLTTPSTAAFRAVKFGAAVAGLVMAFRMWLSIETDSFSKQTNSK